MLSKEAVKSSMALAGMLDSRDLMIMPVAGTPLEALVRATRVDENFSVPTNQATQFELDEENIIYIANAQDTILKASPHDPVMDEITEVSSNAVRNHITFARTVVAPAVQELVEKTAQSLNELTASTLLGFEVVVWNPPAPLMSSSMDTIAKKYEETAFDSPPLMMKMPDLSSKEILDLLKTGNSSLDDDIAAWASTKGESFFLDIWSGVFQQKQAELNDRKVRTFQDYLQDRETGMDNTLAIFLLSRSLFENTLPNIEMSAQAFENLVVEFRNQSGAKVCHLIEEIIKTDKLGVLIKNIKDRTVTVNGSVYKKWIEAGGENEVLFGAMLNAPVATLVDDIITNAAAYSAAWNRNAMLTATVEANRRFMRIKDLLTRHFETQLRTALAGELVSAADTTYVRELFEKELDRVTENDMKDIWTVALKLICRSRFHKTEAERILAGIERVKRENPHVDIREAAAISALEYVSFWVAGMMVVRPA